MQETKVKEFSLGTITYRTLNVPGRIRLLARLGIQKEGDAEDLAARSPNEILANCVEAMEPQVVKIDAKTRDGKAVTTYAQALDVAEFMAPLAEIANELLGQLVSSVAGEAGGKQGAKKPPRSGKRRKN